MRRLATFAAVAALVAEFGFVGTAKADFTFPFDTDLVGYWHFDTNSSTANAVDGSVNSNDGVLQGDATRSTDIPAIANNTNSVALDGAGDDVKIADAAALDVTGALTLAAWVKRGSTTGRQVIISKFNPSTDDRSYQLRFFSDSTIQLIITSDGTSALMLRTSTANFTDTTDWHHVAATYDPSGPTMTLYFDGVAQAGVTVGSETAIFSGSADLFIGQREPVIPDSFNGKIDEVRIYDVVLDAGDIQTLARELPSTDFPAISMTKNQVARLHVFLALPPDPGVPCDLTMSFIDDSGVIFPDLVPEGVSKTVVYGDGVGELGPGEVSTLVLLGPEAFETVDDGAKRVLFRARLSDPDQDCPPVAAVVELFAKADKLAIVTLPPSPVLPPNPVLPPSPIAPPNPILPAFSLHKSLTAQLNVFLALPPNPNMPCNLTMSFVDASGEVIPDDARNDVSETVVYGDGGLGADQVTSLLMPGKLAVETANERDATSVLVRATLTAPAGDGCPPVVAAVELFDPEDNKTTLVLPPSPILPPSPNLPPNPI